MEKDLKKPIIINNKNFKKIVLDFLFPYSYEEKDTVLRFLLSRVLIKTNTYPTEELIANAKIKNFIIDGGYSSFARGNTVYYEYRVTIPDKNILQDENYSYEKTMKFIIDTIYNPYSKDNEFYEEELDKAKNKLKISIDESLNKVEAYSSIKLDNIIDDEKKFKATIYKYKDEIDKVTVRDLYNHYEKVIKSKRPIVFAIGDIDSEFINVLNSNLNDSEIITNIDTNYINGFENIKDDVKEVQESKNFSQSILKVAYKVKDYKKSDAPILSLINFMLSSQSSKILYDYLRYENPLCYVCNSTAYMNYGVLIINVQIYREKKDLALEQIKNVMEKLKNEEFVDKYLENVKDRKRINLIRRQDSIYCILDDFMDNYLDNRMPLDEEYEIIKDLTSKDIVNLVNRLQLDTIYYLEGTRDAK